MNRYKLTFNNNQTLLLYAKSQDKLNTKLYENDFGGIKSIEQYTDTTYVEYINKIKEQSEFLGYQNKYEVYKCPYYKGYLLIRLIKDKSDNTYYGYANYQEHNEQILQPCTFTLSTLKKVYSLLSTKSPEYIILQRRCYGEPKLTKPKELKGIKPIGKATFIPKHCEPQIYVKDNDIYIKHTDYFSYLWRPPKGERIDMPIKYYMEKYFNKTINEKFVYADNWGSIVLRNEAWILLKDTLPLIQTENNTLAANKIFELQKKDEYTPHDIDENEWIRFWENVCKCVKDNYKNE